MERVGKMADELDVPDDAIGKERGTHAQYRRQILMPIKIAQEDNEHEGVMMMRAVGLRKHRRGCDEEEEEEEEEDPRCRGRDMMM